MILERFDMFKQFATQKQKIQGNFISKILEHKVRKLSKEPRGRIKYRIKPNMNKILFVVQLFND